MAGTATGVLCHTVSSEAWYNARTVIARGDPSQIFWDIWDNFWYRR